MNLYTIKELRDICKKNGIKGYSNKKKIELWEMTKDYLPKYKELKHEDTKTTIQKGVVACARLPGRFEGKTHPKINGFKNVVVSSASKSKEFKMLSPFYIRVKEIDILPDGKRKEVEGIFENFWQSGKVWKEDLDEKGLPNKEWEKRREIYLRDTKAHRHIEGKKGIKPLFSFFNGEKMDYDTARRKIYIPLYMKYVKELEGYKTLEEYSKTGNLLLLGPDGRMFDYTDDTALEKELQDLSKPFGHELVLCAMLRGNLIL